MDSGDRTLRGPAARHGPAARLRAARPSQRRPGRRPFRAHQASGFARVDPGRVRRGALTHTHTHTHTGFP